VHILSPDVPYNIKGEGNGYSIDFEGLKVYVAGNS
jgi:hypothetical protein